MQVYLVNDDRKTFEGMWDGKTITIKSKEKEEMIKGLAEHFVRKHGEHKLSIKELTPEEIKKRIPENPLEENDRGEAFAQLKKKRTATKKE